MRLIDGDVLLNKAWDAENGFGWEKVVSVNDIKAAPTIDPVKEAFDKLLNEDTNGIALIDDQSGKRVDYFKAKHGRWIHDGQQHRGGVDWMHCSECGNTDVFGAKSMYHYCPNCGARMRGEEDEVDSRSREH